MKRLLRNLSYLYKHSLFNDSMCVALELSDLNNQQKAIMTGIGAVETRLEKRIKALEKTEEAMLFRIGEFRKQVDKLEEQGYLRTNDDGTVSYVTAKVTLAPEQPTQHELLNQMRDESYRHDILQSDPIELFKEDRQKRLTALAIEAVKRLQIFDIPLDVNGLISYRAKDIMALEGIGEGTVAYIETVLGRHGLSLRKDRV